MDEKNADDISASGVPDVGLQSQLAEELLRAEELIKPNFDAGLYASEYNDVKGGSIFLLNHFCRCGWKEGRNPNADFDTVAYLTMNPDVADAGINPFLHFLLYGEGESRTTMPAIFPRQVAELALGYDPGDWVTLMRPFVDELYYTASLAPLFDGSFDPVAHFAYRGWLDGLNPNPNFNINTALSTRPELQNTRLNPFLLDVITRKSSAQAAENARGEFSNIASEVNETPFDDILREIQTHLDAPYYFKMYPELTDRFDDAALHYCTHGWEEGRNPNYWFDTKYYLATNKDVATQGLNPFWHYLVAGLTEGRQPRQPAGYRWQIVNDAISPDEMTNTYVTPVGNTLSLGELEGRLRANSATRAGLALSLSHDRYSVVTGGIQLFIADEQVKFAAKNIDYLHISPAQPLLRLADPNETGLVVNLIFNGDFVGTATYSHLILALKRTQPRTQEQRILLIHSLFGHAIQDIISLRYAIHSETNIFWVHDYSSLCAGYTLLRNDVAFCKAPPADSLICRICVYGETRQAHLALVHKLFEAISFDVVAPSPAALRVWREHTDLPHKSASVQPHCELVFATHPTQPSATLDTIRVAFIGYPRAHKGWQLWQEIVSQSGQRGRYQFNHFGTSETTQRSINIEHHTIATSSEHPDAMIDALALHEIDLVLILSTWPETFSYVTYEALAAGSDIVCLADSGNVADMVRSYSRGFVANSDAELFTFFKSDDALHHVAKSRAKGRLQGRLIRNGTSTAVLDMASSV